MARGANTEVMQRINWDVSAYKSRRVHLRVVDRNTGSWGHVTLDDFSCEGTFDKDELE